MVNGTEGSLPETGAEANTAVTREQQMKAHPLDDSPGAGGNHHQPQAAESPEV